MKKLTKDQIATFYLETLSISINKSFDDLEKAEGSRGGKVIGHTKSGKPIYDRADHETHKHFTKEDHEDAIGLHEIGKNIIKDILNKNREHQHKIINQKILDPENKQNNNALIKQTFNELESNNEGLIKKHKEHEEAIKKHKESISR